MPTIYGATFDVKSEKQAVNIAYTATELDFHMDLCYYEEPPGIQLLHCLEQAAIGGDSVLADSFAAAFALKASHPEHFEALTEIPVTFHKHHDSESSPTSLSTLLHPVPISTVAFFLVSMFGASGVA